ncbi:MAG: hypothetical protein ABIN94_02595 [Ferruginibacter sp.]
MFKMYSRYRLLKRKIISAKKSTGAMVADHFILPYEEKFPGGNKSGKTTNKEMNAHDLFNMFTADIIKEEVVFTR